jgi:glycogen debranching enzyme
MFSDHFPKLTSYDPSRRFIQSDNDSSYFTVSNFTGDDDGLFYSGRKIFSFLKPENEKSSISYKQLSPSGIFVSFSSNETFKYQLLKNGDGLLVSLKNRRLFPIKNRKFQISLKADLPFEILEKNSGKIIIKFRTNKDGTGHENIFCGIAAIKNNLIENTRIDGNVISFQMKPDPKDDGAKLYVLYDAGYKELARLLETNSDNMDSLKIKHMKNSMLPFKYVKFHVENRQYNKALLLAEISASSFIMNNDEDIGIWAGYPYFLNNWGRDTFISLGGIGLTSGRYEESIHILEYFAAHQCKDEKSAEYGRIPNIVYNDGTAYYNSADSTPLFIKTAYEYLLYTGNFESVIPLWFTLKTAADACYMAAKDENNLVIHKDADDWMDAKKDGINSFSPRGGFAVEIQALWYAALLSLSAIADILIKNKYSIPDSIDIGELMECKKQFYGEAVKLKKSFSKHFVLKEKSILADHLNEGYSADETIRPNALLAFHFSAVQNMPQLIDRNTMLKIFKRLLPEIVFKHGVSSLSRNDPRFHPYHISGLYHKDAAYHNGTVWNWLSGAFTGSACGLGLQDFAYRQTEELSRQLASSGTLAELSDPALSANRTVKSSGTFSQAWSVAEFCRNFFQDYAGIRPNVPGRTLYIAPAIPLGMGMIKTSVRFGMHETVLIGIKTDRSLGNISLVEIKGIKIIKPMKIFIKIRLGNEEAGGKFICRYLYVKALLRENNDLLRLSFARNTSEMIKLRETFAGGSCELQFIRKGFESFEESPGSNLNFAEAIIKTDLFPAMQEKDYLENNFMKK